MKIFGISHIGNSRANQEDNFLIEKRFLDLEVIKGFSTESPSVCVDYTNDSENTLLAVSDGMGGHSSGEIASCLTARYLSENYSRIVDSDKSDLLQIISELNRQVSKVILKAIMPRAQRYNSAQDFLCDLEAVEAKMSDDELATVACEVLMKNETKNVTDNSIKLSRNKSSDETIGMVYSSDEDEASVAENRNLFETFAETPKAPTNTVKDDKSDNKKAENKVEPPYHPITDNKEDKRRAAELNAKNEKKINVRKLLVFGMPPILLLMYIGFYMLLIPALYGETLSFFDWLFADVNHIVELLQDANNILVPVYVIVLLVILQYVILGAFLTSMFFLAKELHSPKVKINEAVKYTGKMPQMMLENVLMALKNNSSVFGRNVIDDLKLVVESMKYSKAFGFSNDSNVVELENEICQLIDELQAELASESDDTVKRVSNYIMVLKQKNTLRDTMLKR